MLRRSTDVAKAQRKKVVFPTELARGFAIQIEDKIAEDFQRAVASTHVIWYGQDIDITDVFFSWLTGVVDTIPTAPTITDAIYGRGSLVQMRRNSFAGKLAFYNDYLGSGKHVVDQLPATISMWPTQRWLEEMDFVHLDSVYSPDGEFTVGSKVQYTDRHNAKRLRILGGHDDIGFYFFQETEPAPSYNFELVDDYESVSPPSNYMQEILTIPQLREELQDHLTATRMNNELYTKRLESIARLVG